MADKLIGTAPNQVSTNGMLGDMAFVSGANGFTPMRWHTRSVFAQINSTSLFDVGFYTAPNYYNPAEAAVLQFTTLPTTTHLFCWYKIGGSTTGGFPNTSVFRGYMAFRQDAYDNSTMLDSVSGYHILAPSFQQYNTTSINNMISTIDPYESWAAGAMRGRAHGRDSQDHYAWSDTHHTHLAVNSNTTMHFKARVTGGAGNTRRCYTLIVAEVNMGAGGNNERLQNSNWDGIADGENQNERTL